MMKGTKKKGRGSEEAKSSKRCLACLLVLLFVIGTLIAPAAVAKGDGEAIDEINANLIVIDDNSTINTFLYDRMLEQEIDAVKIEVIKRHWLSGDKVVKTFYVVRNDNKKALPEDKIDIVDGDDYKGKGKGKGKDEDLWTFSPTIEQTIYALDMLISCSKDCMTYKKAVHSLIRLGILTVTVDKSDNVPIITDIINKSPWASSYLPNWAKNFLERFESLH